MIYAYVNNPGTPDECAAATYDLKYVPAGIEYTEFPDGTEVKLENGKVVAKTSQEISDEKANITKAEKAYEQLQKTMEYTLQGFQIIMNEIDYLRPTAKQPSAAWTAMAAKVKQLQDIVSG